MKFNGKIKNSILRKNLINSSSTPNLISSNTLYFKDDEIDYDKYTIILNQTMKNYLPNKTKNNNYEYLSSTKDSTKYVTRDEIKFIKKIIEKPDIENTSYYNYNHNSNSFNKNINPFLKISFRNQRYISPIHSLGIIKLNNLIYEDLTKSNLERQKNKYDESIKNIESYKIKTTIKMPKIRITMIHPKILNKIPLIMKNQYQKNKNFQNFQKKEDLNLQQYENKLFAYYRYPNKNFPECREQFTLNLNHNFLYLIGGMCTTMKNISIWKLNIDSMIWQKLSLINPSPNRFGHTSIYDKERNKIYIFGGRSKINNSLSQNNILSSGIFLGLEILNLNNLTFNIPFIPSRNAPKLRRNHVAEIIGNYMIIQGGISDNNEVLNDCFILNLNNLNNNNNINNEKWSKCQISNKQKSPFLFGHSACLIIPKDIRNHSKFSIYHYPDFYMSILLEKKKDSKKQVLFKDDIKIKGWYIFGGKSKSESENGISDELYILKLGFKILDWIKVNTNGKKPSPRYFHSMNFYENGNFLIIHGGRNDNQSESFALNDTYMLNLYNLDWIKIILYSQINNFKILTRCGHCSVIYSNKLIICGGMNNNNYLGSSLLIINLDINYNPIMKSTEEIVLNKIEEDKKSGKKNVDEHVLKEKIENYNKLVNKNQIGLVLDTHLPPLK